MTTDSTASGWYIRRRDGDTVLQAGPLTWEEVRAHARAGAFDVDDLVRDPLCPDWVPAGLVPGLFPPPNVATAPRPVAAASAQPEPEPQPEPGPEPETETEPQPDTEPQPHEEPQSEAMVAPQPEMAPAPEASTEIEAQPTPEVRPDQEARPEPTPEVPASDKRRGPLFYPVLVLVVAIVVICAATAAYFLFLSDFDDDATGALSPIISTATCSAPEIWGLEDIEIKPLAWGSV
jgi:hypothetical protein